MTTTVGMVGLGIMGSAMSSNLLAAGFAVTGCDIDRNRIDDFRAKGGNPAASPREAGSGARTGPRPGKPALWGGLRPVEHTVGGLAR